ncbi:MAG: hypothetical protein AAFV29_21660 [Myxococcota bacterium]
MPTPRTPNTNEPDQDLLELFTQAQAEVATLSQKPDHLRQLVQIAEATPERVVLFGFIIEVIPEQCSDDIDDFSLEVFALANRFNRILLATGVYTLHDYAETLLKGLE